jgi:hypothetical protein
MEEAGMEKAFTKAATNSQRLRATIALVSTGLSSRIHAFWNHPRLAELYPEFLFALHGIVAASTPVMEQASHEAARLAASDPIAARLAPYLLEHAEEERGHDEWILDDLERLGIDRERVAARLPYPSVATLVGAQYYWARHAHPVAMLGYLAVLENPAAPEFLESVAARTGIPHSSMSTLLRHARLDVGHVAEFDRMLDTLPLSEQHRDIMTTSAIAAVSYLDAFFADVLERFSRIDDTQLSKSIFSRDLKQTPQNAVEAPHFVVV